MEQKVVITLDAGGLRELERILMDGDEMEALRLLRERVQTKVAAATKVHCKPAFAG